MLRARVSEVLPTARRCCAGQTSCGPCCRRTAGRGRARHRQPDRRDGGGLTGARGRVANAVVRDGYHDFPSGSDTNIGCSPHRFRTCQGQRPSGADRRVTTRRRCCPRSGHMPHSQEGRPVQMVGGAPLRRTVLPPVDSSRHEALVHQLPWHARPFTRIRNPRRKLALRVHCDGRTLGDFRYHTALRPQSCELVGAMDEKRACRGVPPVIMFGRGDNTRCRRGGHLLDRRFEADPVHATALGPSLWLLPRLGSKADVLQRSDGSAVAL